MIVFKRIVLEELLFESTIDNVVTKLATKAKESGFSYDINNSVLERIYVVLSKQSRYLSPEDFQNDIDYIPVLDTICFLLGGFKQATLAASGNGASEDKFFTNISTNIDSKSIDINIKDVDKGYVFKDGSIKNYYITIIKKINQNLIAATAYAKYNGQTIFKSIIQLIGDRLNAEQQRVITNTLKAKSTPAALEAFLADLFQHYQEYSTGNKKADPVIEELLHRVGVTYEKIINIVILTIQYYKSLAQKAVSDPTVSSKHNTLEQQKAVIESNVKINVYPSFAVNGTFVFNF
jgi:hypothetical protein